MSSVGSVRMSEAGNVRMSEAGSVRMSKVIRARKIVRGFEYPSLLLVLVLLRRCWQGAWACPKYGLSACPRQGCPSLLLVLVLLRHCWQGVPACPK